MRRVALLIIASCGSSAPPATTAITATPIPIDAAPDATPDAAPDAPTLDRAARGAQLYERLGCIACHSLDGSWRIGPSWKDVWNTTYVADDGSTVAVDEAYLRESITSPAVKGRQGFSRVMPSYAQLSADDVDLIIAFIQSLTPGT